MQNLPGHIPTTDRGLESNLYHMQHSSQSLLPNMNLKRGEVRRIGQYAVKGTGSADIWEGYYLNEEKVAIKILRAVHCDPQTLRVHYLSPLLEIEFSRHFLEVQERSGHLETRVGSRPRRAYPSFLWFLSKRRAFPVSSSPIWLSIPLYHSIRYVVSPWMVNGTVDEYIKRYPTVDHYALVCTSLLGNV
jgi:hypothetical protein